MDLFFKFRHGIPITEFQCSKKGVCFRQDLEGTYKSRMEPKNSISDGFFCSFLGLNPHNFAKNYPNIENKKLVLFKILL